MEFKNINIFLKSPEQLKTAKNRIAEFEKIDEDIGRWKDNMSEDVKDVLVFLKKIPILYGKQGKLFLMTPKKISQRKDFDFLPSGNFSVLRNEYFNQFTQEVNPKEIALYYEEWVNISKEVQKIMKDEDSTFVYEKELELLLEVLNEAEEAKKKMKGWKQGNLPNVLRNEKSSEIKEKIKVYKEHLSNCRGKEIKIKRIDRENIFCENCGSTWRYKKEKKRFETKLDFTEKIKELEKYSPHLEKMEEKRKEILEEGLMLQKKYSYLDENVIKEQSMKNREILFEMGVEEFDEEKIKNVLEQIEDYQKIERFLKMELSEDICKKYDLEMIEKVIKNIKESKNTRKTKKAFEKQLKDWDESFEIQKNELEKHKKNAVKNIPTSYVFYNKILSNKEVKDVLLFIQSIDGGFGYHVLADTLKGSKQKKIMEFDLNKKAQYGILSRFKKQDVLEVLEGMASEKWIVQKGYDYPKIHITKKGEQILERIAQKETMVFDSTEVVKKEKERFMKQSFERFVSSLDTNVFEESWKEEYLKEKYAEKGVSFYKDVLQFYKDAKTDYVVIKKFVEETYEERYEPIFKFYEKTAKNESLKAFIKEKIA